MIDFVYTSLHYPFLQKALFASILCSIAFGITGPFIVSKRLTFLAGGIAHAVMGGIGVAYYLHANTTAGAVITATIFVGILTVTRRQGRGEDTMVSTLWAVGMSIGIIFIYLTPGYTADLASFIFGNVLMVQTGDIIAIALLDLLILVSVVLFYYHFVYISFDENFMKARGNRTDVIYFFLLMLVALTVVVTIKIIGLILVIALVTLPAVIAALYVKSIKLMMLTATGIGIVVMLSGIGIAFALNVPAGACIILLAAGIYFVSLFLRRRIV